MTTSQPDSAVARPVADRLRRFLFEGVDPSSLVLYRVLYGVILAIHCLSYLSLQRIERYYTGPALLFDYPGFTWVEPLSADAFRFFFPALAVLALMMAAGLFYRWAAALFFLGYLYVFLLDSARYNNHEYLICLLNLLMVVIPAHHHGSLDARRNKALRRALAPAWTLWLLRFQIGVPYFFGGLAKLNYDWLVRGEPIGLWLRRDLAEGDLDLAFFRESWSGHLFAWGGTIFDLAVVPLLVWPKTRIWAFLAALGFHLVNSQLFVIGVFPWMMMVLTTIYFAPDWPRRVGLFGKPGRAKKSKKRSRSKPTGAAGSDVPEWTPPRRAVAVFLGAWLLVQCLLPFRHLLIPGPVDWTEEGHRFAWRMKLRHKEGQLAFQATDRATGQRTVLGNFEGVLTPFQYRMMLHDPEMIRQFAQALADRLEASSGNEVEIRALNQIALNGRPPQPMLDPEVDLTTVEHSWWHPAPWITPLAPLGPQKPPS